MRAVSAFQAAGRQGAEAAEAAAGTEAAEGAEGAEGAEASGEVEDGLARAQRLRMAEEARAAEP